MSTQLIEKVRKLVTEGGMSRSGLARASGLHANTLRDLEEAHWNPTAETLRKLETFLFSSNDGPSLVPIEEIIEEARNGRMFILVDDEDRENEGDVVLAAEHVAFARATLVDREDAAALADTVVEMRTGCISAVTPFPR